MSGGLQGDGGAGLSGCGSAFEAFEFGDSVPQCRLVGGGINFRDRFEHVFDTTLGVGRMQGSRNVFACRFVVRRMSKAAQFDEYGGVDVLQVRDVPRPVPASGELLVNVRTAGINPGEAVIRRGVLHDRFPATFPSGQGSDLAGVVAEVGPEVTGLHTPSWKRAVPEGNWCWSRDLMGPAA